MREDSTGPEVTGLLLQWAEGDRHALDQLVPLVYREIRRIAARQLQQERPDHTLAPTALVHELYVRLVDQRGTTWENRNQFFALAARVMRRVLVDHARARKAAKRGGSALLVSLDAADAGSPGGDPLDIVALDEALQRLGAIDPEQLRLVELRFFAGLTVEETAQVLGCSGRTVKREWRVARAWLHRELGAGPATS